MPTTKPAVTKRYCPKLSEVMTLDDLPEDRAEVTKVFVNKGTSNQPRG